MDCQFDYLCDYKNCNSQCRICTSLEGMLQRSKLPLYQWNNVALKCYQCDSEAFARLSEIQAEIRDRVETLGSKNLIICSEVTGNGKTSWAIKIMKSYFASIALEKYLDVVMSNYTPGVFVPTNQFVLDAKDFNGPFRERYYKLSESADKADITIWDDIGANNYTEYDYNNLMVSIDRRIFAGKMNIFTTNFTSKNKEFIKRVGNRLADRIWDTAEVIQLNGKSLRR